MEDGCLWVCGITVEEATRLKIVGNKKEEKVTRVPVTLFKTHLPITERLPTRLHPLRVLLCTCGLGDMPLIHGSSKVTNPSHCRESVSLELIYRFQYSHKYTSA